MDQDLPAGLAANAAAALALSLAGRLPDANGPDLWDGDGSFHPGILRYPIPILRADGARLKALRSAAEGAEGLCVLDFSDLAQSSLSYDEYAAKLSAARSEQIAYRGLCLFGDDRAVKRLTGSLALYR